MNKPKLSIIAPAHRTEYWLETYKSICENDISFEIIFVTDKKPDFKMPPNFRYIYSTVKPAQCIEIAYRESVGELIHWTADDTTYAPHSLDYACELYDSLDHYKNMIAFRVLESGFDKTDKHYLFMATPITTPSNTVRTMPYGIISRYLFEQAGGFDINFIAGQWENDLVLRAYAKGGEMHLCEKAITFNDDRKHKVGKIKENNLKETHPFESELLRKMWIKNNKITFNRTIPVEPYVSKDLLTKSQGNKGKWE